jgi:hypothetical protein
MGCSSDKCINKGHGFGSRRIYYDNFAEHLLNAYNPNMTYPDLPYRWSDDEWRACVDMVAAFGFNVFEFWPMTARPFSGAGPRGRCSHSPTLARICNGTSSMS